MMTEWTNELDTVLMLSLQFSYLHASAGSHTIDSTLQGCSEVYLSSVKPEDQLCNCNCLFPPTLHRVYRRLNTLHTQTHCSVTTGVVAVGDLAHPGRTALVPNKAECHPAACTVCTACRRESLSL